MEPIGQSQHRFSCKEEDMQDDEVGKDLPNMELTVKISFGLLKDIFGQRGTF